MVVYTVVSRSAVVELMYITSWRLIKMGVLTDSFDYLQG